MVNHVADAVVGLPDELGPMALERRGGHPPGNEQTIKVGSPEFYHFQTGVAA